MSKKRKFNSLTKKNKQNIKKIILGFVKKKYPIDVGYIEKMVRNAVRKTFGEHNPVLVERILNGDFSYLTPDQKKMIENKLKLSVLQKKQEFRIKGFRKRIDFIKPILDKSPKRTTFSVEWYRICLDTSKGLKKALDHIYKSDNQPLKKISMVWKISKDVYRESGFIGCVFEDIEKMLSFFIEIKIPVKYSGKKEKVSVRIIEKKELSGA